MTIDHIISCASSPAAHIAQAEIIRRMASSVVMPVERYEKLAALARAEGEAPPDMRTLLWAAAPACDSYLEIGSRRGHSLCSVLHANPTIRATCCDIWLADYGGEPNPGEALLRAEADKFSSGSIAFDERDHPRDAIEVFSMPSAEMFGLIAGRKFDLALVDGSHDEADAAADLRAVWSHLEPGGFLVFDDLDHPQHPYLRGVWDRAVAELSPDQSACSEPGTESGGWAIARKPIAAIPSVAEAETAVAIP